MGSHRKYVKNAIQIKNEHRLDSNNINPKYIFHYEI